MNKEDLNQNKNIDNDISTNENKINNNETNNEKNKTDLQKNKKSKIIKALGICTIIGVCSVGSYFLGKEVGANSPATSKLYFNQKLASVNGENISFNDFKAHMNIYFHLNKTEKIDKEKIEEYESQLVEYYTLNKAVYDVAIKNGTTVSEEDVTTNYSAIMTQLSELLNMDESTILKKFKLTKEGVIESIKMEQVADAYLEEQSQVSEEDALKYYNENPDEFYEYKASHILISKNNSLGKPLSNKEQKEAKEKANDLLSQIKNGANFEELAKTHSDDTASAENGGDLGYFKKGDMVDAFQTAIEGTHIGQLHPDVIETEYGYHIIKRTGENTVNFDEEKESIIFEISYNLKNDLVTKIKEEANIQIYLKSKEQQD